ncbi:CGI-121-domain-containing protein, partial [Sistotremastrum niveocremeum HHB9708]
YAIPHLDVTIHIALYQNVSNSEELLKRIIAASTLEGDEGDRERALLNYAFVDPTLVTSLTQLQTAVDHALLSSTQSNLRTKTVHSEIIYILNPTNNIMEALRRFGVSKSTRSLILIRVNERPPHLSIEELETAMNDLVNGEPVELDRLSAVTDWAAVRKMYKLNGDVVLAGVKGDEEKRIVNELVVAT